MKRRLFSLGILLVFILAPAATAATPTGRIGGLQPGVQVTYSQSVPVNLVFVGYDMTTINSKTLMTSLPASYTPVVRDPQYYGLPGRPVGLKFNFTYHSVFANPSFNAKFFGYLSSIGKTGPLTQFQQMYNDQKHHVLEVTPTVAYIDAPSVEKYLESGCGQLGLDCTHSYTIFYVNWYGRQDFKFHVYTKTNETDPDTGYNFGKNRDSRKMIAWGGTSGRTWFYDLSAGPEAWTNNWSMDNSDVDGDGKADYFMPPIWEYRPGGYRSAAKLTGDLVKVARYVGIDLLFTPSPLYDPLNTAPELGGTKIVNLDIFEDDPASSGLDWFNKNYALTQWSKFEPYYHWAVNVQDFNPIDADAQRAERIWADVLTADDCWNAYGTTFAELFCFFDANRSTYVPAAKPADYVAPLFMYNTTAANLGDESGLLGYADDNWTDGTQSYVFGFDTADYRDIGYGFSTTAVHEAGHHIGLSHPHDGYDSASKLDYGPAGSLYFAWSGDESDTIMHYMDLSTTFQQFNKDSMYRYEMAGFLNKANALLAQVLAAPKAKTVMPLVTLGGSQAQAALTQFNRWDYSGAVANARASYLSIDLAARQLGITPPAPQMLKITPNLNVMHEGDPIRFPDN